MRLRRDIGFPFGQTAGPRRVSLGYRYRYSANMQNRTCGLTLRQSLASEWVMPHIRGTRYLLAPRSPLTQNKMLNKPTQSRPLLARLQQEPPSDIQHLSIPGCINIMARPRELSFFHSLCSLVVGQHLLTAMPHRHRHREHWAQKRPEAHMVNSCGPPATFFPQSAFFMLMLLGTFGKRNIGNNSNQAQWA